MINFPVDSLQSTGCNMAMALVRPSSLWTAPFASLLITSNSVVNWSSACWLHGTTQFALTPPRVQASSHMHMSINLSAGRSSIWPILPRRFIYSSNIADVDPVQLTELWAKTLKVRREPVKIMKSLKHSYVFVVVLTRDEEKGAAGTKIVGVGRAISDGAFIATICDVAVDPAYQRRGIGRKIVKYLVKDMKKLDGPSGFAVFPPPLARRFFWMIGFRCDKKFNYMMYREQLLNNIASIDADSPDSEMEKKMRSLFMAKGVWEQTEKQLPEPKKDVEKKLFKEQNSDRREFNEYSDHNPSKKVVNVVNK